MGCAAGLWVSYLIGQKQPVPHGLTAFVVLPALASTITIGIYDHQIKLFWVSRVAGPYPVARSRAGALPSASAPEDISGLIAESGLHLPGLSDPARRVNFRRYQPDRGRRWPSFALWGRVAVAPNKVTGRQLVGLLQPAQELRRCGASVRSARAGRTYDRVMEDSP